MDLNASKTLITETMNIGEPQFDFPSGYKFFPTDDELIVDYLSKKYNGEPLPLAGRVIEVEVYKFNPKDLFERYKREKENVCYFFTSRDRKYPKGNRPARAADGGFWKATGVDKVIKHEGRVVGKKRSLVFYTGNPQSLVGKTNWIMQEYTLDPPPPPRVDAPNMRLDDVVLCRIYHNGKRSSKKVETPSKEAETSLDKAETSSNKRPRSEPNNKGISHDAATGIGFVTASTNDQVQCSNTVIGSESYAYSTPSYELSRYYLSHEPIGNNICMPTSSSVIPPQSSSYTLQSSAALNATRQSPMLLNVFRQSPTALNAFPQSSTLFNAFWQSSMPLNPIWQPPMPPNTIQQPSMLPNTIQQPSTPLNIQQQPSPPQQFSDNTSSHFSSNGFDGASPQLQTNRPPSPTSIDDPLNFDFDIDFGFLDNIIDPQICDDLFGLQPKGKGQ